MTPAHPRIIQIVHVSDGRIRLRLAWLHHAPDDATTLADALAALPGMVEVSVRPRTGSVLCAYDPDLLDAERIVTTVRRHTRVAAVLRPGEQLPEPPRGRAVPTGSSVARAMAASFSAIDRDVLAATDGRLDLGTLTGLGFLAAGAAEIAATRTLPAPPWFNLAWWALRTFTLFDHSAPEPPPEQTRAATPPVSGQRRRPHRRAVPVRTRR